MKKVFKITLIASLIALVLSLFYLIGAVIISGNRKVTYIEIVVFFTVVASAFISIIGLVVYEINYDGMKKWINEN